MLGVGLLAFLDVEILQYHFVVGTCRASIVCVYIKWLTLSFYSYRKVVSTLGWKSIESLYPTESATSTPGVRLCLKLTEDHVWLTSYIRMRVNLAAQVRILCGPRHVQQYFYTSLLVTIGDE